jgi:hypothetical protein
MTAAYRVVVVERAELLNVTLLCEGCDTALTLNVQTAVPPLQCASCGCHLSEQAKEALLALRRFHCQASAAEKRSGKPNMFRFDIREGSGQRNTTPPKTEAEG